MEKGVPIRSLSRGLAVLQALNRGNSLSMMEISRTSEVPYPTACRIVQTLLVEGMIEREPARKRYRPTALVQTLAHGFQGHGPLVRTARAHIVALTEQIGWPVSLSTHVGHSMVIRDSTHALTALTFNQYFPGYSIPMLECASGLAYLAYMVEEERQRVFDTIRLIAARPALHTLATIEKSGLLDDIVLAGHATRGHNKFTNNPGKTSSIAAPILRSGAVVGTVSLAFFSSSMTMAVAEEKFAGPLKRVAQAIGEEIDESALEGVVRN